MRMTRPPRRRPQAPVLGLAVVLAGTLGAAGPARADDACRPNPLGDRTLHLRGSFNGWATPDEHRFVWACDRFELVATLSGEHRFKVGDEDWSADADFGGVPGAAAAPGASASAPAAASGPAPAAVAPAIATLPLHPRGADLQRRLEGTWRFVVRWPAGARAAPTLEIGRCPDGPPLGATTLFLRGTMNNWASLEDGEFQWRCDAYWLNVTASGAQNFKIADAGWTPQTTFGRSPVASGVVGNAAANGAAASAANAAPPGAARDGEATLPLRRGSEPGGTGDITATFSGEQTLRLAFDRGVATLAIGPRRFTDPRAVTLRDPLALALRHDSRDVRHRAPFGAVKAGTTVQLAVQAPPGVESITLVIERRRHEGNQEVVEYLPLARVPMRREDVAAPTQRWVASHRFAEMGVHGYWFEARIGGKAYALQNNADAVHWTREKGTGGVGSVAPLPARLASIRRYRVSVYDPAFRVPAWAPDAVVYTIYPDRYRNGDASNDPRPGTRRYQSHDIEFHARWLDKPWRPGTGDGSDGVHNNDFFGGDLAGIIEKLDELKALGVNTLYLLPLFHAASNHKYDTADYRHIDPAFGTDADYTRLTVEARRRGIRVIADTSLNHTGSDSVYFDRFGNFGQGGAFEGSRIRPESRYAGWYRFDPTQTEPDKQYRGWVGVNDLPELDKASPAWREFAYRAKDSVTRLWLQRGASGWRMDVAPWVSDDFWREWRQVVKATQPDAITIAETWFDPSRHLLGDMFDSTMNYIFRNAVLDYAKGGPATALAGQLEMLREAVPPPAHAALMNLVSSHDVARALHVLGHEGEATPAERVALAKRRLVLATFLQMTYPGAPALYYGDEVGVTGGDDPYNRAPYPWPDLGGQPDGALRDVFRQLVALRRAHPVLRHGSLEAPLHADANVLVRLRRLGRTWALVASNNSGEARRVEVSLPDGAPRDWTMLWTARAGPRSLTQGRSLTITIPPVGGTVLTGWTGPRHP